MPKGSSKKTEKPVEELSYEEALEELESIVSALESEQSQLEEAIKLFELSDVKKVADGNYRAESIGYEAPIHVEVAVQSGRIESVRVVQHKEKQFYSALTDTPAKIIAKQGVKGIDATSSATITSEAIINATAKALASGAK